MCDVALLEIEQVAKHIELFTLGLRRLGEPLLGHMTTPALDLYKPPRSLNSHHRNSNRSRGLMVKTSEYHLQICSQW